MQPISIWRQGLIVVLSLIFTVSIAHSADKSNRTLFGNAAVQRELKLTDDQKSKINAILSEMEVQIAKAVKAAKDDPEQEADIVDSILIQQGPQLEAVLDKQQALRIWQIGLQAGGSAMFNSGRVRRVLNLTTEQLTKMSDESEKSVKRVTLLAKDPSVDRETIEEQAEIAKQESLKSSLAVLTARQRADLQVLLGKPFDVELLKYPDGQAPRPLTFVFGIDGKNAFLLVNSPLKQELELSESQSKQIKEALQKNDKNLTSIRLSVLKGADKSFPDLSIDEQRRLVQTILAESASVHRETKQEVLQILSTDQRHQLEQAIVRLIGARAIEFDTIATRLQLTAEQTATVAKRIAEFEETTAPLRVVRDQSKFESLTFDKQLGKLEAALRGILTPEQAKALVQLGK
ncbi:MAG: hypothetical protein JWP89_3495 [Schlesneria sp.]|nr:hypothetical protein [Schlesneria sp.]